MSNRFMCWSCSFALLVLLAVFALLVEQTASNSKKMQAEVEPLRTAFAAAMAGVYLSQQDAKLDPQEFNRHPSLQAIREQRNAVLRSHGFLKASEWMVSFDGPVPEVNTSTLYIQKQMVFFWVAWLAAMAVLVPARRHYRLNANQEGTLRARRQPA